LVNQVQTAAGPAQDILSAEAVERFSRDRGEPAWLTEQRLAALERAVALPVPTMTTEGWRRTDLSALDLDRLVRAAPDRVARADRGGPEDGAEGEQAGALRLVDGALADRQLAPHLERRGVLLMPLADAVRERPDLLERHLGRSVRGEDSKFVSLAGALWQNGIFLYVPRGVAVELPIIGRTSMAGGAPCFFRTVVVVDEGAEVTYVDDHSSDPIVGEALASGAVEIYTGQAARARYVNLQRWNDRTWHFNRLRAVTGRDARVDWLVVAVGGRLHRAEIDGALEGQGSEMEMVGLIFGDGRQHFDHQTVQDHVGNDTRSDLNFKAALGERSSSNYTGLIRVNERALRTDSNLENRNLLLSDHSRAESDPRLEILNSDVVRCAHGATVGPLDPEMIYYIQSRGLPRPEAQRLVVEAFFEPVLQKIPVESIRANVWRTIQRKLGREIGAGDGPAGAQAWQTGER
jgi:Fe-S cluster assembly protein SufD